MANITTSYFTQNPCYKAGRSIKVTGLMLHSVGCPQSSADVFAKNWNKSNYNRACVHGFIDDKKIIIGLPCLETTATSAPGKAHRGWHAGASANNTHIGFEMCEPSNIKYTSGSNFTCSNKSTAIDYVLKVTANAVEVYAKLCIFHKLDPLGKNVIISHKEGHALGIASNHGDPEHLWSQLGMNYNMDKFRQDVAKKVKELQSPVTPPSSNPTSSTNTTKELQDFTRLMREYRRTCLQTNASGSYSKEARDWAVKIGLITGSDVKLPNGEINYMWGDFLSREQFVTVLYRFAKLYNLI